MGRQVDTFDPLPRPYHAWWPEEDELPERTRKRAIPCARCGSRRTLQWPAPSAALAGLVLNVIPMMLAMLGRRKAYCYECGHEWRQ